MTQGLKILCLWMVLGGPALAGSMIPRSVIAQSAFGNTFAIQTLVAEGQVCGLAGHWLQLPEQLKNTPRAWVTMIESHRGGPAKDLIRWRNRKWVSRQLMSESQNSLSKAEMDARFRQCRDIQPRYFEAVLVQHQIESGDTVKCSWLVDWDMDQDFTDEVPERLNLNLVKPEHSDAVFDPSVIEMSRVYEHRALSASVYQPFAVALPESDADADSPAQASESQSDDGLPDKILAARSTLLKLDDISVRKQHLRKVVAAADQLLSVVEGWPGLDTEVGQSVRRDLIADTLYRRGRALGYMELPDVIAVHPILDQQWLDTEFEATFQRLKKWVDVRNPEYILLAIRRERRLGNRGLALNLVDQYRKTHPKPVWHFKKKLDLMAELGATLHAHQAACAMWLNAEKPDRPTCCVIRVAAETCPDSHGDWGAWREKLPWRPKNLTFCEVKPGSWETVVWLDSPDAELSGDVLSHEKNQSEAFSVGMGTVRRFELVKSFQP